MKIVISINRFYQYFPLHIGVRTLLLYCLIFTDFHNTFTKNCYIYFIHRLRSNNACVPNFISGNFGKSLSVFPFWDRIKTFAGSYICNKTEHTNSDKVVPRPCGPWELSRVKTTHAKTFKQHFYRRFIPQRSECFFRQVGTTNPRPF